MKEKQQDTLETPFGREVIYDYPTNQINDDTSIVIKGEGLPILGQAVHCNLEDHLSKEQYLKLIEFAIAEGTNYFTFNIPNSQCDDCGFITKHPIKECPKCHSKNITQWTRTIGYLRPIKSFDYYRQIEASKRVYSKNIK